jgi:hypothetical protein
MSVAASVAARDAEISSLVKALSKIVAGRVIRHQLAFLTSSCTLLLQLIVEVFSSNCSPNTPRARRFRGSAGNLCFRYVTSFVTTSSLYQAVTAATSSYRYSSHTVLILSLWLSQSNNIHMTDSAFAPMYSC